MSTSLFCHLCNRRTEIQHYIQLDVYFLRCWVQRVNRTLHWMCNCIIVASSAFTSSVAFASFTLVFLRYYIKCHRYCTKKKKKKKLNSFRRKSKTLACICKVLYLGPCCLHELYSWFHVYLRPHSRCLSPKQ